MSAAPGPESACDLRAAYVLAALEPEETTRFENHLAAGCRVCETELAGDLAAATALALDADDVAPDAGLREALLARASAPGGPPGDPAPSIQVLRAANARWRRTPYPGVEVRVVRFDGAAGRMTVLLRVAPGRRFPAHVHGGDEETYLLEGDLRTDSYVLAPGDVLIAREGSLHQELRSETGCVALVRGAITNEFLPLAGEA